MNRNLIVAGVVGIFCGILSTQVLFVGSWLNIPFWGIVGMAIGWWVGSVSRNELLKIGAVYGWFLTVSFMLSGFRGSADRLPGFLLLTLLLSVVGILCGIVAVWVGNWLRKFRP